MRFTRARLRPWTGTRRSGPTGDGLVCVTTPGTSGHILVGYWKRSFCPTLGIRRLTPRICEEYSRPMGPSTTTWRNWAGNHQATAAAVRHPTTTDEVADAVRTAAADGRTVKPVGTGHSFTAAAAT